MITDVTMHHRDVHALNPSRIENTSVPFAWVYSDTNAQLSRTWSLYLKGFNILYFRHLWFLLRIINTCGNWKLTLIKKAYIKKVHQHSVFGYVGCAGEKVRKYFTMLIRNDLLFIIYIITKWIFQGYRSRRYHGKNAFGYLRISVKTFIFYFYLF